MTSTSIDALVKVCSYYRDAEMRGSNLLYRMLRHVEDPEAQMNLSEHLADETRHAWLWTKRIRDLGRVPEKVVDGYQVRIGRRAGIPRNIIDLFALTVVVEQRALRRYQEHLRRDDVDEETLEILRKVSEDEGWHLDWMRKKGREFAEKAGEPERFDASIQRFREIDAEVMQELDALEQSLA
jgi:bacterioferritin (cytochrome b1)